MDNCGNTVANLGISPFSQTIDLAQVVYALSNIFSKKSYFFLEP